MKKLLMLAVLLLPLKAHAVPAVYLSSNTSATDNFAVLCGSSSALGYTPLRAELYKVIVSSAAISTSASGITLYNSSFTTVTNQVGPIDGRTVGSYEYNVIFPKGLMYSSTTTANFTILYQCL